LRNLTRFFVVIAALFTAVAAHAANEREKALHTALDREVPRLLTENNVPSVSIARIEGSQLVFAAAYGTQSAGVPATTKTLYNIASMTKPISAEVVLRLASEGRLTLDEPMYVYWTDPDIAGDERRKQLTARLALSHRTGFPNWRRQTGGVLTFKQEPGTYGYSGEGYEYVARFAEKKAAGEFETLAQKLVLEPAGMTDTAYTERPWFEGRIAVPVDAQGKPLKPAIAHHWLASDLLYTTPSDYAKFVLGVMRNEGQNDAIAKERIRIQVSRKADECAKKPAVCPDDLGFGLGWEVFKFHDATYLMHTGKDDGVFTLGYINMTDRDATILFTNGENGAKLVLPILDAIGKDRELVELLRSQAG